MAVRRGVDTNVLLYAHLAALPQHKHVRQFLHEQLQLEEMTLVVTPIILHELVHVITDERRFQPAVPMVEALKIARLYLGRSNVECLALDGESMRLALDLLERHRLGRKRIADTLFAATLLQHGITELITCNPSDFKIFGALRLIDPRLIHDSA